ncbi:DUF4150 domain-containing protein [Ideonella sp.]|uniref:DUF4150 domain-containing protein n=1 Tax=Ideonella sp. TaxID=1929293 RepID=UPI003BB6EBB9
MGVTVKVNGTVNSLAHKGATHSSPATMPDVCKTPSPGGPVPMPYPNVTMSSSLDKGSSTVKADGGNMIAIKGSEYAMSQGDEPGTAGGVKSSTFKKESTWILYSFDVKIEGKNACRLTDKKFQNHENTVDLGGDLGPTVLVATNAFKCAVKECDTKPLSADQKKAVKDAEDPCLKLGEIKHACVKEKMEGKKGVQNEPSYDTGRNPPERLRRSPPNGRQFCPNFFSAFASVMRNCAAEGVAYQKGRMRRPDCVIGRDQPRKVLDAKFPCPDSVKAKPLKGNTFPSADQSGKDLWRPGQKEAYQKIAGKKGNVEAVSPHDVNNADPPISC